MSMAPSGSHQVFLDTRLAGLRSVNAGANISATDFYYSFWGPAAVAPDQLRQRVKFALSEIFVISLNDPNVDVRGAANYYDMLGIHAFANYRALLEQVSLHPMMGRYLTHLANQREDTTTGRSPDENYAREVMQLMSLGLYELNPDGTRRTDAAGQPIPTYDADDISGLARVFTGFSWYSPTPSQQTFFGQNRDLASTITPMVAYPQFHSLSAKVFLTTNIPASTTSNPTGDLRIALDAIFNHPNTGPFVSRQLIQRLVTSNPSPGYVARVAAVFANNGSGTRGDLGAVVRTILLDPEARDTTVVSPIAFGKLREPLIRMTNWMRAFGANSVSGSWLIGSTSSNTSLSQSPLAANSVFNFFRPGYIPPNTRLGGINMVAPEFQIVDEVSVAGYFNTMQTTINSGIGTGNDVTTTYAAETAIADDADALLDRINLLLLYGQMTPGLRTQVRTAVIAVTIPAATPTNAATIATARLNRAKLAVFMVMTAPEYLAQR